MKKYHNLSILDAIENLSHILELKRHRVLGISKGRNLVVQRSFIGFHEVRNAKIGDREGTINLLREIFATILSYLKDVRKEAVKSREVSNHVKNIMVLVGDAAARLDNYTELFSRGTIRSAAEIKEYRQLQTFYLKNFFKKVRVKKAEDEGRLAFIDRIFRQKAVPISPKVKFKSMDRVLSTLNTVARDDQYELFYLSDETGGRFFTRELIRDIKSACNFGEYWVEFLHDDPLINIKSWHDQNLYIAAQSILKGVSYQIDKFYREVMKFKEMTLVATVNKALMALMLASHPKNLIHYGAKKNCHRYFADFLKFLREALSSSQYKKLQRSKIAQAKRFNLDILNLIHALCRTLFVNKTTKTKIANVLDQLIEDGLALSTVQHEVFKKEMPIHQRIISDYEAIFELLKKHPNGPLFKALDYIREGKPERFDSLAGENIPFKQFDLYIADKKMTCVFLPSPTNQKFVHHANVFDEFKGFLRGQADRHANRRCLLFNLQDKTDWKEYARCRAIENLQMDKEFSENLVVVTLDKNTDFYHQRNGYRDLNNARDFIDHFKEHLICEACGFSFPKAIREKLFPSFTNKLMRAILKVFFPHKRNLSRQERLNFIELFYFFLELKIIEIVKPDVFSFTCKDGVDVGSMTCSQFYLLLKMINDQLPLKEKELDRLRIILFEPALMVRERVPQLRRINRLVHLLRDTENYIYGPFKQQVLVDIEDGFLNLYDMPIFHSRMILPR